MNIGIASEPCTVFCGGAVNGAGAAVDADDRVCANCRFRDYANEQLLPVRRENGESVEACCPCLAGAVEMDVGYGVPMLAEDGHCRAHHDLFQPCEDFLDFLCARA